MPFVSFLVASLVAFATSLFGRFLLDRFLKDRDVALKFGVCGLAGLGAIGTLAYFGGLITPVVAKVVVVLALLVGVLNLVKAKFAGDLKLSFSLWSLAISVPLLLALVGVLTPSTASDWDSLAYHLAVPKLWQLDNKIGSISFIHHSNFPGAVDMWFYLGGNQYAAKTFTWWFTLFGCFATFGTIREVLAEKGKETLIPWICTLAFASVPMVIWESGTAYVDVAHGLFAGLGFYFTARYVQLQDKNDLLLSGCMLAGAASSKYTGLQSIFIAALVILVMSRNVKASLTVAGVAFIVAGPWYLKNLVVSGNPVYPFFYGLFGGKNWDAFQSAIYTEEQKTFGMHGVMNLGSSILGLVTSPGRFTNPSPSAGAGFAWVSLGFAVVAGGLTGVGRGLTSNRDRSLGLIILVQMLAWFALSQQSRYITVLLIPMTILMAQALTWKPLRPLLIGLVGLQCLASIWIIKDSVVAERLPVLIGALTEDEFLGGYQREDGSQVSGTVSAYGLSKIIDADPSIAKVALFDEVFGYYLNKPYLWATPGHTTEFGYAEMQSADDFVASFKKLGVSHIYLTNSLIKDKPELGIFEEVSTGTRTYTPQERSDRMKDQRNKWRVLLAEAISSGKVVVDKPISKLRTLYRIP